MGAKGDETQKTGSEPLPALQIALMEVRPPM
jgi:hypothetical protein